MAPKKYLVYSRGPSKCVVPSHRLVISSDVDNDLEYMSPSTQTPTRASRTTRGMTMKVELDLVTTSQSDEEGTLTDTPSGSTAGPEAASGSQEACWYEEV